MSTFARWLRLAVLSTAASAVLVACGGGDAGPPAETQPPSLNISTNAGAVAVDKVLYTFTFSEDVGSSFAADDVAVTNGSKGALTKVSATQYTMEITPAAAQSGNLTVSVAAGSYQDLVTNAGLAASSTQAFDTTVPAVTITSSASGSTASGTVTFSFTFSKDVGNSFDAADVGVTGGTKGSFTMTSTTQASLQVVPSAGTSGTMTVSVAAGAFADAAGRANTAAASASQAFNTVTAPTLVQIVRANASGAPAYDASNGKAQPGNYVTGIYSANAGEAWWWGGNYAEQIQAGFGISKTNTAQWGFGLFIANGGSGWDISNTTHYNVNLGSNGECAGVCKATLRLVSASAPACVADAKVTLTSADINTSYSVPLSSFTVAGCATNTMAAFKAMKVAELHFQLLRGDMQFTTSGDPNLFPNGLGVGGNIYFNTPAPSTGSTPLVVVRANAAGTPSYDASNGKALPGNFTTGVYSAGSGEAWWWGGNYAEQIQAGYGFSKTNTAQWGFGLFIANGGAGWDISGHNTYTVNLGSNAECAGVCRVTLRLVSASNPACLADAKLTLTSAALTSYTVPLSSFTVAGCSTNTVSAFKALKVGELHFQLLRGDMQFTTSGDPNLFPNGLGVGGNIRFD